jgi:polysaccharide pyruvyl transferase WcaK-like protein
MHITVLGYYHRHNLGDTIYTQVMPALFPQATLTFHNLDDLRIIPPGTDAIICGGGDLINSYFHDKLIHLLKNFHGKKIALSVGISFESFRHAPILNLFDHIFFRNLTDTHYLQSRLGSEVVHYLPDLAFSLNTSGLASKHWSKLASFSRRPRLGLFYIASISTSAVMVQSLINLTLELSRSYDVRLYRFNTSNTKNEDDGLLNSTIAAALPAGSVRVKNKVYTIPKMLRVFSRLDVAVCMRYHSHILAILTGTPFISISTTRKVDLLMSESHLDHLYHPVTRDSNGNVLAVDVPKIIHQVASIWHNRVDVRKTLLTLASQNRFLLQTTQPSAVLLTPRVVRPHLTPALSVDSIYESTRHLILSRTGYDVATRRVPETPLPDDVIRHAAEHMSFLVTRTPNSSFVHGTVDNLRHRPHELYGMIDYMIKNHEVPRGKFNLTYLNQNLSPGLHRSGWQFVVNALMALHDPHGAILDTYVDRTFHWDEATLRHHGVIPYTSPWVGILHHTPLESYSDYNTVTLLAQPSFRQSLPQCRGLYVLSRSLGVWLREALEKLGWSIPIEVLVHPTEFVPYLFTMNHYLGNPHKKLVQIGAWLRNTFSIYAVHLDPSKHLQKYVLQGPHMQNYLLPSSFTLKLKNNEWIYSSPSQRTEIIPICRVNLRASTQRVSRDVNTAMCRSSHLNKWVTGFLEYLESHKITFKKMSYQATRSPKVKVKGALGGDSVLAGALETLITSVTLQPMLSNSEYDEWLSENLVFVNLLDCSAVNTVIECIVRNTPIVINRMRQTVDILGSGYPLFYTSLDEIDALLTPERIREATEYLRALDKEVYRIESFIRSIKNGPIYLSL